MNNNRSVSGTHRAVLYNAGIDDKNMQRQIDDLKKVINLQNDRYSLMEELLSDYKQLVKTLKEKDEKRNET